MKQAVLLLALLGLLLLGGYQLLGYQPVYALAYGAISIMAVMIALTFLWLWAVRATPLALGMSFSWAGAGLVMGWWWLYNLLDRPAAMTDNPALFVFLSIYFVGAFLHFGVIERSFGFRRLSFTVPIAVAILAALAVQVNS